MEIYKYYITYEIYEWSDAFGWSWKSIKSNGFDDKTQFEELRKQLIKEHKPYIQNIELHEDGIEQAQKRLQEINKEITRLSNERFDLDQALQNAKIKNEQN